MGETEPKLSLVTSLSNKPQTLKGPCGGRSLHLGMSPARTIPPTILDLSKVHFRFQT
jgi:hypothetical protein